MSTQSDSMSMVRALVAGELSLPARLGYVALLLVSAGVAVAIASLWLTEPALPARTQVAFGAMTVIGACWAVFSLWALATRRKLFARDQVIAGWMAVAFTGAFCGGAIVALVVSGRMAAVGALVTGAVMLGVAVRVLVGARRKFAALTSRRAELEKLLGAA